MYSRDHPFFESSIIVTGGVNVAEFKGLLLSKITLGWAGIDENDRDFPSPLHVCNIPDFSAIKDCYSRGEYNGDKLEDLFESIFNGNKLVVEINNIRKNGCVLKERKGDFDNDLAKMLFKVYEYEIEKYKQNGNNTAGLKLLESFEIKNSRIDIKTFLMTLLAYDVDDYEKLIDKYDEFFHIRYITDADLTEPVKLSICVDNISKNPDNLDYRNFIEAIRKHIDVIGQLEKVSFDIFYPERNCCVGAMKNLAMSRAIGKYIHICDDDDFSRPIPDIISIIKEEEAKAEAEGANVAMIWQNLGISTWGKILNTRFISEFDYNHGISLIDGEDLLPDVYLYRPLGPTDFYNPLRQYQDWIKETGIQLIDTRNPYFTFNGTKYVIQFVNYPFYVWRGGSTTSKGRTIPGEKQALIESIYIKQRMKKRIDYDLEPLKTDNKYRPSDNIKLPNKNIGANNSLEYEVADENFFNNATEYKHPDMAVIIYVTQDADELMKIITEPATRPFDKSECRFITRSHARVSRIEKDVVNKTYRIVIPMNKFDELEEKDKAQLESYGVEKSGDAIKIKVHDWYDYLLHYSIIDKFYGGDKNNSIIGKIVCFICFGLLTLLIITILIMLIKRGYGESNGIALRGNE